MRKLISAIVTVGAVALAGCSSSGSRPSASLSAADIAAFGLDGAVQALFPGETHTDAVRRAKRWCALRRAGHGLLESANGALDDVFPKSGGSSDVFRRQAAFTVYASDLYCPEFRPGS